VRVEDASRPVRGGDCAGDEVRDRERFLSDERLFLSGEGGLCALVEPTTDRNAEAALVDARTDIHVELERRDADVGPPEAELVEKVERQSVAAGWLRHADCELELGGLPRLDRALERRPQPIPDDRVSAVVEPMVRGQHAGVPARAPGGGAGVLEPKARGPSRIIRRMLTQEARPTSLAFDPRRAAVLVIDMQNDFSEASKKTGSCLGREKQLCPAAGTKSAANSRRIHAAEAQLAR